MKPLLLVSALALLAAAPARASEYSSLLALEHGDVILADLSQRDVAAGRGGYAVSFHIGALVKNRAYGKSVKAVWTVDDWSSAPFVCPLQYVEPAGEGYELWTADCAAPGAVYGHGELALSVTQLGATAWDNGGGANIAFMNVASPLQGVEETYADVYGDPGSRVADVYGRIYPFPTNPGRRSVEIVFTTDGWQTTLTYPVSLDNGSSEFRATWGLPAAATAVEYALHYRIGDIDFWDNNGGANYRLTVN